MNKQMRIPLKVIEHKGEQYVVGECSDAYFIDFSSLHIY